MRPDEVLGGDLDRPERRILPNLRGHHLDRAWWTSEKSGPVRVLRLHVGQPWRRRRPRGWCRSLSRAAPRFHLDRHLRPARRHRDQDGRSSKPAPGRGGRPAVHDGAVRDVDAGRGGAAAWPRCARLASALAPWRRAAAGRATHPCRAGPCGATGLASVRNVGCVRMLAAPTGSLDTGLKAPGLGVDGSGADDAELRVLDAERLRSSA